MPNIVGFPYCQEKLTIKICIPIMIVMIMKLFQPRAEAASTILGMIIVVRRNFSRIWGRYYQLVRPSVPATEHLFK